MLIVNLSGYAIIQKVYKSSKSSLDDVFGNKATNYIMELLCRLESNDTPQNGR
jgi:hypothetical protein